MNIVVVVVFFFIVIKHRVIGTMEESFVRSLKVWEVTYQHQRR